MAKTKTLAVKKVKPTPEAVPELESKHVVDVLGGELITGYVNRSYLGFPVDNAVYANWDRFDLSIRNFVLLSSVKMDKDEFCARLKKRALKEFDETAIDTFANLQTRRRLIETADYSTEFNEHYNNLFSAKIMNAEQILNILISEYNSGVDLILDHDRIICKELATNKALYGRVVKYLVDQLEITALFDKDSFYDQLAYDDYGESHEAYDVPHNIVDFITAQLIMMLSIATLSNPDDMSVA